MANFLDKWAPLVSFRAYVLGRCEGLLGSQLFEPCCGPTDSGKPSKKRERMFQVALGDANSKLAYLESVLMAFEKEARK